MPSCPSDTVLWSERTGGNPLPRKPKPPKLTDLEQTLLEYPPTRETWWCIHTEHYESQKDGETIRKPIVRRYANAGSRETCAYCTAPKPENAPLVWPEYETALAKQEALQSGR